MVAGGVVLVGAFVATDFALRAAAAPWWAAVGGSASAVWPWVDALGLAGALVALYLAARDAQRWPLPALLVATAAIMMPVGLVLAFGFRDAELAAGWSCVQLVPLAIASGLLARHAHARIARIMLVMPTLATLASATAMITAAGLAH